MPLTGMPRILGLLGRYGIKTWTFIPGWIVERCLAPCEDIVRRRYEVGHPGCRVATPWCPARLDLGATLGLEPEASAETSWAYPAFGT